ncbi:hypothetical protein ABVT39_017171 [Epinephelus coioides]
MTRRSMDNASCHAKNIKLPLSQVQNYSGNPLRVAKADSDKHIIFTQPFLTSVAHTIGCWSVFKNSELTKAGTEPKALRVVLK